MHVNKHDKSICAILSLNINNMAMLDTVSLQPIQLTVDKVVCVKLSTNTIISLYIMVLQSYVTHLWVRNALRILCKSLADSRKFIVELWDNL